MFGNTGVCWDLGVYSLGVVLSLLEDVSSCLVRKTPSLVFGGRTIGPCSWGIGTTCMCAIQSGLVAIASGAVVRDCFFPN